MKIRYTHKMNKNDITCKYIKNYKNNKNNDNNKYNMDIINELILFEFGNISQIKNAINNVINKNDINEIIDYLNSNHNKTGMKYKKNYIHYLLFIIY